MNLLTPFLEQVDCGPDKVALIGAAGESYTYSELDRLSSSLAGAWRKRGVVSGDYILVAVPVSPDLYLSLLAVWKLGAAAIFPEPFAGLGGLTHAARRLQPKAVVSHGWRAALLRLVPGVHSVPLRLDPGERGEGVQSPAAVQATAPALFSFTSGSTGTPKGIERSHAFMLAQNNAVSAMLASEHSQVDLVWFPVFVLACLASGSTAVLPNSPLKRPQRPNVEALVRQIQSHHVSRLLAPPAVAMRLAEAAGRPQIRHVFTGGGPIFPQYMRKIRQLAPAVTAVYGSTEAEPIACLNYEDITSTDWHLMTSGEGVLAGKPVAQAAVRIEDNEILVAGDHVVSGYIDPQRNEGTKIVAEGRVWHRTGDAGRIDSTGRLWLRGRLTARVGNLWPFEVEAQALSWPAVSAAALIADDTGPVLAIAGHTGWLNQWKLSAAEMGIDRIVARESLPMDRRHASKLDYVKLAKLARKM